MDKLYGWYIKFKSRISCFMIIVSIISLCYPSMNVYAHDDVSVLFDDGDDDRNVNKKDSISNNDSNNNTISNNSKVIKINNSSDFDKFAKDCKYDSYSLGKTFELTRDIEINIEDFNGIPYFNGTFNGNGHVVKINNVEFRGTDYGFFRYVGKMGKINNLIVKGNIDVKGSAKDVGGIVGVNYGTVSSCSFEGKINAEDYVGGIAGINKDDAVICSCSVNATILATNYTGGIVGDNFGLISECSCNGKVNTDELDSSLEISDSVDIGAFNVTNTIVTRNNMGGIAGGSSGIIVSCINYSNVGYNHVGYNVGGIAGRQSGQIVGCTNQGNIMGRKDVGGIAGQAEPFVESDYLDEKLNVAKNDIDNLSKSVTGITNSVTSATANSSQYMDALIEQYGKDLDSIKDNINDISSTISDNRPETEAYVVNINKAIENIENISKNDDFFMTTDWDKIDSVNIPDSVSKNDLNKSKKDSVSKNDLKKAKKESEKYKKLLDDSSGSISSNNITGINEKSLKELQDNYVVLYENLLELEKIYSVSANDTQAAVNNLLNEVQNTSEYDNVDSLVKSVDSGTKNILAAVNDTTGQLNKMAENITSDLDYATENDNFIKDLSSIDSIDSKGVISSCKNNGNISGDINIGGISGSVNLEYEKEPEFDLNFADSSNIRVRTSINDVVIYCINNGNINSKRNYCGGIVANQSFGLVYGCESYGNISTDSGDYIGGIVGCSEGTIQNCYSISRIIGNAYEGGICGYGCSIINCVSLSELTSDGEFSGAIAGYAEDGGEVIDNYFMNDKYEGIDGISYMGIAERMPYDVISELSSVPGDFDYVKISFALEDNIIEEKTIPYGSSLIAEDYPELEQRDGYYIEWEELDTENIYCNTVVNANYIPWSESVASPVLCDKGTSIFLVSGQFYANAGLKLKKVDGPTILEDNQQLLYAYSWRFESVSDDDIDAELSDAKNENYCNDINDLTGYFYAGDDPKNAHLYVCIDGSWVEVDSEIDGSYLKAKIDYHNSFAVIKETKNNYWIYYLAGGTILILALLISIIKRVKLKKLLREKENEIRKRDILDKMKEN